MLDTNEARIEDAGVDLLSFTAPVNDDVAFRIDGFLHRDRPGQFS
ncbi:hypothetical protein [Haloactinopolyspora sp.]|nr:hypothetical protein [Haloactinopolyspora sp.]